MGKGDKECTVCNASTCNGQTVRKDILMCTTYSCHYSRDFKSPKAWEPFYKEQQRRRSQLFQWGHINALDREAGARGKPCPPVEPRPGMLACSFPTPPDNGTCQAEPYFVILPKDQERMFDMEHHVKNKFLKVLEEKRRQEMAMEYEALLHRERMATEFPQIKSAHWAIQRQRDREMKYVAQLKAELSKPVPKSNQPCPPPSGFDSGVNSSNNNDKIPNPDISEPKCRMLKSKEWKGIPIPCSDPRYERIFPANMNPVKFRCDLSPFKYCPRNKVDHQHNPYAPLTQAQLDAAPNIVGHYSTMRKLCTANNRYPEKAHIAPQVDTCPW